MRSTSRLVTSTLSAGQASSSSRDEARGVRHLLEVVEQQQRRAPGSQVLGDRRQQRTIAALAHAERRRDGRDDQSRVGNRRKVDERRRRLRTSRRDRPRPGRPAVSCRCRPGRSASAGGRPGRAACVVAASSSAPPDERRALRRQTCCRARSRPPRGSERPIARTALAASVAQLRFDVCGCGRAPLPFSPACGAAAARGAPAGAAPLRRAAASRARRWRGAFRASTPASNGCVPVASS